MNKEPSKQRYLTTEQRRSALKLAYNDRGWISRVDKMPNKQVYAIFDKMRKSGQITYDDAGNLIFRTKEEIKKLKEAKTGHQITFDEYMKYQEEQCIEKERKTKDILKGEYHG